MSADLIKRFAELTAEIEERFALPRAVKAKMTNLIAEADAHLTALQPKEPTK